MKFANGVMEGEADNSSSYRRRGLQHAKKQAFLGKWWRTPSLVLLKLVHDWGILRQLNCSRFVV